MPTSGAELIFGALPLLTGGPSIGDADYVIEALGDGADWGNPNAAIATVASMLMDGEKAEITRYGNRQATIPLRVKGANLDVVATGEAAIMGEVSRGGNTLTWTPPGWSTSSVFDVVYAQLDFLFDDLNETRVVRHYTLTLTCLPFARRDALTTVVADPIPSAAPTTTTINACTSVTGWTTDNGGGVTDIGADGIRNGNTLGGPDMNLKLTGLSTAFAATDYIVLEWETDMMYFSPYFAVLVDGVWSQPTLRATQSSVTRAKWYYDMPTGTLSQFTFALHNTGTPTVVDRLDMYEVSKVDQLPLSGTRRQRSFTAEVGGTARTQADLVVEVGSGDLGSEMLLYTAPLGAAVSPPMRSWLASSTLPVTDSGTVSGAAQYFTAPSVYRIPAAQIPAGSHLIVARLLSTSTPGNFDFTWSAGIEGSDYTSAATDQSGSITVALGLDWTFEQIAVVTLPTVGLDPPSGAEVEITLDTTSADVIIDELYLFNLDAGELTHLTRLDAGADTPTRAVIRSASLNSPRPQWLIGTAGTSADDVSAADRAESPGQHEFRPGTMSVFVVTPGSTAQTVTGTWYERFGHHVPPQVS